MANPGGWAGYGPQLWGLTACDGPLDGVVEIGGRQREFHTYWARGASFTEVQDDGTLAPTAAGGSIALRTGDRPADPDAHARDLRRAAVRPLRLLRRVQPDARAHGRHPARAGGSRHSAGSTPTIWGSTRGRSWPWSRTTAAGSCGGRCGTTRTWCAGCERRGSRVAGSMRTAMPSNGTPVARRANRRAPRGALLRSVAFKRALRVMVAGALVVASGTGCGSQEETLRFWAMGREGEVVTALVRDFERENPGVHVQVQQIPWSRGAREAPHRLRGPLDPRHGPARQHLARGVRSAAGAGAARPLGRALGSGGLEPLLRRHLGHQPHRRAPSTGCPGTWTRACSSTAGTSSRARATTRCPRLGRVARAMEATQRAAGDGHYAILLPLNEWPPVVILGLQAGSPLLADNATHGAFREPAFRRAFDFYTGLFRAGLAPPVTGQRGRQPLPGVRARLLLDVHHRPLESGRVPAPAAARDAGGLGHRTLARPGRRGDRACRSRAAPAWCCSAPRAKRKRRGGSPSSSRAPSSNCASITSPAICRRASRPGRTPLWQSDPNLRVFGTQLERVTATPKIPEWELITTRIQERAELAVRGAAPPDSALALLDRDVERILEKRRWLLEQHGAARLSPRRCGDEERPRAATGAYRLGLRRARAGAHRGLLLRAGGGRVAALPHRLRPLCHRLAGQRPLRRPDATTPDAREPCLLEGAAQHPVLRGRGRAALGVRVAGGGAAAQREAGAVAQGSSARSTSRRS